MNYNTHSNKLSKRLSQHFLHDLSLQPPHFTDVEIFNLYVFKNEFFCLKKNV